MNITLKSLGDLILYFGALAAALAAIGVLIRYVAVQPLKRWIKAQILLPNGGNSIRDSLNAIEKKLDDHIASHH